jgi:DNA-binding LacI/PurR family transcriptional regulator
LNRGRKTVTAADVAVAAGVSQSAVSRAFTPNASISEDKRRRILDAAARLSYSPNALARSLITQRSGIFAMVMGDLSNPFYPEVLHAFSTRLQGLGKQLLFFSVTPEHSVDEVIRRVLQYRVEGAVITSATLSSEAVVECRRARLPVLLFNRLVNDSNVNAVVCDNLAGGRSVADLLHRAGHRRFAYITGIENTSTNVDRQHGYCQWLAEQGESDVIIEPGNYSYQGGREAAKRLMLRSDPPDAIFCANDITALGALDAIRRELGLRVPEDVSVVGFDDIPTAKWPAYDLTTVRQRINRMTARSLDILVSHLDNPALAAETHAEPGMLIVRGTTRIKV